MHACRDASRPSADRRGRRRREREGRERGGGERETAGLCARGALSLSLSLAPLSKRAPRTSDARLAWRPFGPARAATGRASLGTHCSSRARGGRRLRAGARGRAGREAFSAVGGRGKRAPRWTSRTVARARGESCGSVSPYLFQGVGRRSLLLGFRGSGVCVIVAGARAREGRRKKGGRQPEAAAPPPPPRPPLAEPRRFKQQHSPFYLPPRPLAAAETRLVWLLNGMVLQRRRQTKGRRRMRGSFFFLPWGRGDGPTDKRRRHPTTPPTHHLSTFFLPITGSQSRPTRAWPTSKSPLPKGNTSTCPNRRRS